MIGFNCEIHKDTCGLHFEHLDHHPTDQEYADIWVPLCTAIQEAQNVDLEEGPVPE